ncbi:MAG: MaoC family dehydratase [Myxococcaceae bacterium]|nr:MaoC family dehydratase [Myxococcaceae bacterium]
MNAYTWEQLQLGLTAEFAVEVSPAMMERFTSSTGDLNPLHLDPGYARQAGFDDRVVYGMLTASFFSTLAGVYLPGERCLLHGVEASFHKPVYVGDTLTVRGEVAYRNEAFKQAELKCRITNQRGEKVSSAKLKVGVRV